MTNDVAKIVRAVGSTHSPRTARGGPTANTVVARQAMEETL